MKKILVIAASILSVFPVSLAIACSCLPTTPQQSFESSQAVFAGQAIEVTPLRGQETVRVTFRVSKVWKGRNSRRLVLTTSNSSASCGFNFEPGQRYLVYASAQRSLTTNLCSGTKLLSGAQADLVYLEQGRVTR
jgi:Tissue inhibitor of metalloproteinase